jgi:predicted Zn-dependent peptidase
MRPQSRVFIRRACVCAALFLGPALLFAQTFDAIKSQVKEHTLPNGMKFLVLERPEAPVVSFHTYADVGSSNESYGITGISHLLEHLAFKGTKVVGTRDYASEQKVMDQVDRTYQQLVREQTAVKPDSGKIATLKAEFDRLGKEASGFVVVDQYTDLMREQGGPMINAYTSNDATQYISSLPSNKLEFWMAMESDRWMNPVFREFYKERNVVMEERRLGVETQPMGKLIEDFLAVAFKAHPYHHEVVGHMSDLQRITRADVRDYFQRFYGPSNLTVAIVGDVKADELFKLADTYFSRIPTAPKPEPLRTTEPEQWGERRVTVEAMSQPMLLIGYHRPNINNRDDAALDAMANILGRGRSSRLYESLVKKKKVAFNVYAMNGWPGNKYSSLFVVFAMPSMGHTAAECQEAIEAELARLKTEPVTEQELSKYKRFTRKWLIDGMKMNGRMGASLTFNEVVRGDWRKAFDIIKVVDAVSAPEVQAVAQKYLVDKHRTIGDIKPEPTPKAGGERQ